MNIEFGVEDIDVSGEIDKAAILRVLERNKAKFENCFQVAVNQKPSIQGTLRMQWKIYPKGNARQAKALSDQLGSRYLSRCVGRVLERLNFPAPPAGQIPLVTFPFRFYL